ncbi:MAG: hypothetical protein KZQ72_05955, partial [Candidatus Thiodiazotropha sp. (ex Cardiolucina cf. quadrata)]|nr:hypothetical protein [Candidatus Thiodiazotropha sp. (ex Cardiolucina cf. quadrata)]
VRGTNRLSKIECLLGLGRLKDITRSKTHLYVNVVHTVDGAWNLDGLAMTNKELGAAIAQG